ncbi:DNA-binding transcription factor, MBF transcription factor complex subunit Cdc10 [Schizosaccharomyces osmophilus]|uniref:DNA-binding transcription factor, MBF transcription factor complex subunit Cdc10 n=1 Tax=Schizosaccharomyces osmophilus TaxID=2545709 RepID=A0AAE9W975_9SCHI|nr:DNA-binding transcription factor, MBF transcription factor complex subunit Cdc10 [Schizosaccharomyces osmophilus]WBW71999.1 DNA-binding transcription factor, MBF transcription factor complex subunit Cdc10 [Schizosaccharomyces osmophilus]
MTSANFVSQFELGNDSFSYERNHEHFDASKEDTKNAYTDNPNLRISINSQVLRDGKIVELNAIELSGVRYIELQYGEHVALRRCSDSHFNISQILRLAGTNSLENAAELDEIIENGEYENVDIKDPHVDGVWVPFGKAVSTAKKYGVYDMLQSLISFNLDLFPKSAKNSEHPEKETQAAYLSNRLPLRNHNHNNLSKVGKPSISSNNAGTLSSPSFLNKQEQKIGKRSNMYLLDSSSITTPENGSKRHKLHSPDNSYPAPFPSAYVPSTQQEMHLKKEKLEFSISFSTLTASLPPLDQNVMHDYNTSKDVLTSIFLDLNNSDIKFVESKLTDLLDLDVPIDELGHAALHWAAALAKMPLLNVLISRKANSLRGNLTGETALMRSVMVTNHLNQSSFHELLNLLYPSLNCIDHAGRTVVHHICLTAGIKGRGSAARYYLETLLKWADAHAAPSNGYTNEEFIKKYLNYQDKNGDTAVNIAARIGNKTVVDILLQAGASKSIPNRAGLTVYDFGIFGDDETKDVKETVNVSTTSIEKEKIVMPAQQKSKDIITSVTDVITSLDKDFQDEMAAKQSMIDNTYTQLRESTKKLAEFREQLRRSETHTLMLSEMKQRCKNLEVSIEEQKNELLALDKNFNSANLSESIDADAPFMVNSKNIPSLTELKIRIAAYERNEARLNALAETLHHRNANIKSKCRRVVSLCTGVEETKVDSLLESLLQAVESDGQQGEVDMGRVAGFLRVVKEHQV